MALYIRSLCPNTTVFASILFYNPKCGGQFEKMGWWSLALNQVDCVYGGDCKDLNRYFYVYAEATDGTVWNGPSNIEVTNNVYNACVYDNTGDSRTVGFFLLDIGSNDDFTLNLAPVGYVPPPPAKGGSGGGWNGDGDGDDDADDGEDDDADDGEGDDGDG